MAYTIIFLISIEFSRIFLSVLVMALIANYFGVSAVADAFFIAQLFTLRIGERVRRAVNMVFVPIYTEYRMNNSHENTLRMTNVFASKLIFYSIMAITFYALLSPFWLKVVSYDFINTQAEKTVVILVLILSPALLFIITHSISESIFLSYGRFKISAYASLLCAVGSLIGIMTLSKYIGIYSVGLGASLGILFGNIFQYWLLKREKHHFSLTLNLKSCKLDWLKTKLLPVISYGIIFQLVMSIDRLFAIQIGEGIPSSLTYASNISILFPVVIASSTIVSILPRISQYYAVKDFTSLSALFNKSLQRLMIIITPLSVLLFVLGDIVIRLVLQHGKFDSFAAEKTIAALKIYSIGSIAQGLWVFTMGIYISLGRVRYIFLYALFFLGTAIILNYIFMLFWGYIGLPLATSIVFFLQFFFFYNLVKKDYRIQVLEKNYLYVAKIVFASLCMGGLVWLIKDIVIKAWNPLSYFNQVILLVFLCVVGMFMYVIISKLIGIDLIQHFLDFLKLKYKKTLNDRGNTTSIEE